MIGISFLSTFLSFFLGFLMNKSTGIFSLNDNPNGVIKTDAATPDGFWIQDINIVTTNIETENETHIKIYF